jgi:hypothetical protein
MSILLGKVVVPLRPPCLPEIIVTALHLCAMSRSSANRPGSMRSGDPVPMADHTPSVFISYRRDDSAGWAGRLEDDLADVLGAEHVFRDIAIPPGVDYEQHIERVLDSCHVVIVVIGPRWLTSADADGTLRLAQPDDLLRREVERALLRQDVVVVPVLVQRATMPAAHELPAELEGLARRQAVELSDARWRNDVAGLVKQLSRALRGAPAPAGEHRAAAAPAPHARSDAAAADAPVSPRDRVTAFVVMLAAAILGLLLSRSLYAGVALEADDRVIRAAEAAVVWAAVGMLLFAAAAATVPGLRANPIGWAIAGLFSGAVAGALSAGAYIGLEDSMNYSEHLLPGVATAVAGVVLGLSLARRLKCERYRLAAAGLLGGLLGGMLAGAGTLGGPDSESGPALMAVLAGLGTSPVGGLRRLRSRA